MNQRAGKMHSASLSQDDSIKLSSLIKYLREAEETLDSVGERDAAHFFDMLADHLINGYKPKEGLVFRSIQLGL